MSSFITLPYKLWTETYCKRCSVCPIVCRACYNIETGYKTSPVDRPVTGTNINVSCSARFVCTHVLRVALQGRTGHARFKRTMLIIFGWLSGGGWVGGGSWICRHLGGEMCVCVCGQRESSTNIYFAGVVCLVNTRSDYGQSLIRQRIIFSTQAHISPFAIVPHNDIHARVFIAQSIIRPNTRRL